MTDTTTNQNGTPAAPQEPGTTPAGNQATPPNPNAEAAKYRRRLRDAEAELAQAQEQLAEFQQRDTAAALGAARTEHAERIGHPALAEHLAGDTEEEVTADADRLATIATTVLDHHLHPDTGVMAQAADLLAEHGVTPEDPGFTLTGAAQLLHQLPTILTADNPAEELAAVLETARPIQPAGPFTPTPQPGILRQIHGGDAPRDMSMGEAMRGMF